MIGFLDKIANNRIARLSILSACFLIAAGLRLSNQDFVLAPFTGHFNFIDTDCYYYMRRLVHFLSNFPSIMVFDPLMDWPTGGTVDWPEGFLLILGIPLKIFGVDSHASLEAGVTVLMLCLGLFTCVLLYIASCRVLENFSLRVLALFFAACNFLLVRFSCLGQVDHHILEAMFPPLFFILSLEAFQKNKKWAAVLLGLLITYSLSISSSSLFVITATFGVYGIVLGARENLKSYFIFVVALFLSLVPYALWSIARRGNPVADNYPSYFHISLMATLAALAFFVAKYRQKSFIIFPAFIGVASLCYFLNWPTVLVSPLNTAFSYVFGKSGVLQNVSEAFPLYASYNGISLAFMHINFGLLVYLLPLVWFLNFFKKYFSLPERALFFILSVMSVPGIAQKRFSHLMVGLYIIFICWVLSRLLVYLRRIDFRLEIPILLSWAALTIIPIIDAKFSPQGSPRDMVDLGTSKVFLEKLKVDPKLAWDRLAGKVPVTEGIWASPNMGHMLMYYTGLGTVDNSFYHPRSFDLEFKLRNIESQEEFKKELRANRIRYIILADDWQFFELQFQLRGLAFSKFMTKQMVKGTMSTVYSMPEFMKIAWSRMLLADSEFDGFERMFGVQFHENHYYNFLRGYRLLD